jgi:septum formation protein
MSHDTHRLTLASGSDYKRQLLARLDLEFQTDAPNIDETSLPDEPPRETARRLAAEKAVRTRQRRATSSRPDQPPEWTIAADQIIKLDGERLTKPGSASNAADQLERLAGNTHLLSTAVALAPPTGEPDVEQVDFQMTMRPLDRNSIDDYVARDHPIDCAGAYKIESGGIRLFTSMRGDDYTAIIGLPLTRVWTLLDNNGYLHA